MKNTMKRIGLLFTMIMILMSVASMSFIVEADAWDPERPDYIDGVWGYNIVDGGAEVAGYYYEGDNTHIVVPDYLGGYPVTHLAEEAFFMDYLLEGGKPWFSHLKNTKTITIPASVIEIEPRTFQRMMWSAKYYDGFDLMEIKVNEGGIIKNINGALIDTSKSELIFDFNAYRTDTYIVPDGIKIIGDSAFEGADFKKCVLSDEVETIGERAFNLYGLKEIELNNGLKYIGELAFFEAPIESITLPDSVEVIGGWAFNNCTELKNVNFGKGLKRIEQGAFLDCVKLEMIDLGENILYIGEAAFKRNDFFYEDCVDMKTVIIRNPDCEIFSGEYEWYDVFPDSTVIYGYPDSTAQEYAEKAGLEFVYCYSFHKNKTSKPSIQPTCYNYGYTEGIYCDDCGNYLTGHNKINKIHSDNSNDGLCDICGEHVSDILLGKTLSFEIKNDESKYIMLTVAEDGLYEFRTGTDTLIFIDVFDIDKNYVASCEEKEGIYYFTFEKGVTYYLLVSNYQSNGNLAISLSYDICNDDNDTIPDTPEEPEELNFFEKIIEWFKNIFDKLFGWMRK